MKMEGYNNCGYCGSSDIEWQSQLGFVCNSCHRKSYINVATAAGCYLYDDKGNVLIAQRAKDPWKGKFDDPGGFMELDDEVLEDTVVRELEEELGIVIDKSQLRYVANHTMMYHYDGRGIPVCAILFCSKISDEQKQAIHALDDVANVKWVSETDFDEDQMVSPSHAHQVKQVFAIAKEDR